MDLDGSSSLVVPEGSGSVPAGHVQGRRHTGNLYDRIIGTGSEVFSNQIMGHNGKSLDN